MICFNFVVRYLIGEEKSHTFCTESPSVRISTFLTGGAYLPKAGLGNAPSWWAPGICWVVFRPYRYNYMDLTDTGGERAGAGISSLAASLLFL